MTPRGRDQFGEEGGHRILKEKGELGERETKKGESPVKKKRMTVPMGRRSTGQNRGRQRPKKGHEN